jgi:hypothetical protein
MNAKKLKLQIHLVQFLKFWFKYGLLKVRSFVIKKRQFYKELSKDSYNINKLMIENMR